MTKKRTNPKTLTVGNDLTGDAILGDGNTVHKTSIDSEGIHQGLQDVSKAIYENTRKSRWEQFQEHTSTESESREIQETISISFFSGISIGAFWNYIYPWNIETVLFFILAVAIFFNTLKLTHLRLRHSLVMVSMLWAMYTLTLKYTALIQNFESANLFVGTAILGTLGAGFGLFTGAIQLFWKPLGD